MYTVVWNKALAQRDEFLVLGGARRDAVNTTGVFHTGAKKALVAFHLLGQRVTVASSDDQGDYLYYIDSRATQIGDIVQGIFSDGEGKAVLKECTYTTAIADNAWLSPIRGNNRVRAFGQFILNAVGTAPSQWGILKNVENITLAPPGFTRVYVPQTKQIEDIVDQMDVFFSWGKESIGEQVVNVDGVEVTVQVLHRPECERLYDIIYVQGMIAYWEPPIQRPFRYAYGIMGDETGYFLSEERHLRSIQTARSAIEKAYTVGIDNNNRSLTVALVAALADGEGELSIWAHSNQLGDIFRDRMGLQAVIADEQMVPLLTSKVREPIVGIRSSGLMYSLETSGIKKAIDTPVIRGARQEKPLTEHQHRAVKKDLDILQRAGLCAAEYPVAYFVFDNIDPHDTRAGVHEQRNATQRIGIRSDLIDDQTERRQVLVHEHRHLLTDASDLSAKFGYRADQDLVRLAEELYNRRGD